MSMHAALLIGSPKGPGSTSDALGTYLLERLEEKGVSASKTYIQRALLSEQGIGTLLGCVQEADIIILAAPLYADSHHSGVVAAMELIHGELKNKSTSVKRKMIAISNCGFPESRHNEISLAISRRFAFECGFEWAGGLALGGGEYIAGRRLEKAGGPVRNVRKSLGLAADALAKGEKVPEEAIALMARPLMPRWLYLLGGNIGWRRRAKRQGCKERLNLRPYRS
jgi:hypothetical protein